MTRTDIKRAVFVTLERPAICGQKSAPGRNRTGDLALRRHSLYPLSYQGLVANNGGYLEKDTHSPNGWP